MMPIGLFYRAKTCDVRLMRRLIWAAYHEPASVITTLWSLFDILGEVLDDLADVEEDRMTYNGNRFAFFARQHGSDAAIQEYRRFVDELSERFTNTVSQSGATPFASMSSLLTGFELLKKEVDTRIHAFFLHSAISLCPQSEQFRSSNDSAP
jgi:hypothetical protein